MEDWYKASRKDVTQQGGNIFWKKYSSLEEMLRKLYPEHTWQSYRFAAYHRVPPGHWNNKENLLAAISQVATKLGIEKVFPLFLLCCVLCEFFLAV